MLTVLGSNYLNELFSNLDNTGILLSSLTVDITTNRESSGTVNFTRISCTHLITPCHRHVINDPKMENYSKVFTH